MATEPTRPPKSREAARRRLLLCYDLGRIAIAALATLPVVLLGALAVLLSGGRTEAAVAGLLAIVLGAGLAWSSRDRRRAIPPGMLAGLLPLATGLGAHFLGETWLERPAWLFAAFCIASGALASWLLGRVVRTRPRPEVLLVPASALTVAVGSMGWIVLGGEELLAMLLGFCFASSRQTS